MRIFSAVLMLLILAMNFKPCADEVFSKESSIDNVVQAGSDHQDNENDDCSPFCYCACCSVRSFSATALTTTIFLPQSSLQKPVFLLSYAYQISFPIWQPPQLV